MPATTIELTKDNFEQVLDQHDIVLIDFWAPWCGPCKVFGPIFEEAAGSNEDIAFGKVNTDVEQELAGLFRIRSIPTLMVFREKIGVFAQPGALPKAALEDIIRQVRELDMEKVKEEVAKQEAGEKPGNGA